ncbi:hypothetical protein BGX21_002538 [Mortierella sp. AD011]|nr:hypothetical protein BGX20_009087 [Mortierella sp. AD010]KAF9401154.1 hypothetical protein BGX21_002538 [Mortierella sp. AD011]
MSSSISLASITSTEHPRVTLHDDVDPRPSSTSVVATLRHSPRLLLRKKASALKEPTQSPDIFARGPGPALRASTRLQTRNTSARMLNARTKKASRQQHQQENDNQLTQYTNNTGNSKPTTTTTTTHLGIQLESTSMTLDGPVQTRSSRSLSAALSTAITATEQSSRILATSGHNSTSIATEDSNSIEATGVERRSRIATRSLSQTRTSTRTRTSRTRAHARTIPIKALTVTGDHQDKSDDDDDDDDEVRFRYHLRSPTHHRRRRSLQKPTASEGTAESPAISNLNLTPRLTRLGARHESGHDFEDEPDQEQPQRNRHLEKAEKSQVHGRRSRSSTSTSSQDSHAAKSKAAVTTYSSPGAQAAPRKVKKKSVGQHKVPSLPASRRRLRARTTKVAKMGIDGEGVIGDEDDEDEEEDDDEEEEEEEEEDVDYDNYRGDNPDEEMMEVEAPSSGLQSHQQTTGDINPQSTHEILNGFIASKPEASLVATGANLGNYAVVQSTHTKRKVDDEDMEDAPAISMDEGQVVSTKLARIDDVSDGEKNAYLKTFYSILKNPRGDDDDGILSSESDDADLESEDDDDDFEEIDIWEFIGTLPPLGPLPQNFVSTMPERTSATPPITLVLDIDETLVHCATRPLDSPDIIFPVEYNNETWEVYGRIRPGMQEFLEKTSAKFEVITFTASQECYAEALLKIIDPEKKYIKHRYYRDSCIPVFGNYIKDLRILNRDLSKVVIIDNSPQAFGYQISNGVPIDSWYDDKSDRELSKVMSFLETLEGVEDVRPRIDEQFKLQERLQRALAQQATHQQISNINGLGALGTALASPTVSASGTDLSSLSSQSADMLRSAAATPELSSSTTTVTNGLASLQSVVPDNADLDTTMMLYDEVEKPPSPSDEDDEREEDEEKNLRGKKGRSKVNSGGIGTHGMTMTTRSNLDATNNLVSL